ncbi:MAG: ComEC/Rec2 family competence protein, partial [Muribaculaceae bacterium]|nr:ComEC/Rec2 family competence protein [Muribaculaceae bacterium]
MLLAAICLFGRLRWLAVAAVAALPGLAAGDLWRAPRLDLVSLNAVSPVYSGIVAESRSTARGQWLMIDVDSVAHRATSRFRVVVSVENPDRVVAAGDVVCLKAFLSEPDSRPQGSGAPWRLFQQRVSAQAELCTMNGLAVCGHEHGVWQMLEAWRDKVADAVRYSPLRPAVADFAVAVMLGDRGGLDGGVRDDFTRAGMAHVLALSGTHVAVMTLMVSVVFLPLRLAGRRRWVWVSMMLALWCYALLTGLSPSVTRAVIMTSFILVGRMRRLRPSSVNSLCGAALLILAVRPFDLFDIGFQLSF